VLPSCNVESNLAPSRELIPSDDECASVLHTGYIAAALQMVQLLNRRNLHKYAP